MKHFLTITLLVCINILCHAQATSLTVENKIAGTLSQRILYDDKLTVENLVITGVLNGDDCKFIQELNSSYKLTGTLDLSDVLLTGYYSNCTLSNNINVNAFRTKKRLNKLILPKSATKWTESVWFSSTAGTNHLNVDSLIILDPKFTQIGGIGNPSYLYIEEGVETFYMNNSENGPKFNGKVEFFLPSSLKDIYITSSRVGTPDYITIHANMSSIPRGFSNNYGNTPSDEELAFFSHGVAYVPEGTKTIYQTSMFKNLEIIAPVSVSSVSLDELELRMNVGDVHKLSATVYPTDADDKSIVWFSADESIAKVSEDGIVTAVAPGNTQILAVSHYNREITDACAVTVIQPATGISLDKTQVELVEEESMQLHADVLPENASNKGVSWTSSDNSIAMISQDGMLYAIKPGKATIMATAVDGGFSALCRVVVMENSGIESVIDDRTTNVKIYNVNGYLIYEGRYSDAKLAPGFYILKSDGKSYKLRIE